MKTLAYSVCHGPLTGTDPSSSLDVGAVFTLQPFTSVTGVHFRARLPFLTGTNQTAGAVIQDQGHPRGTDGGLLGALASPRTGLGPGKCKNLCGKDILKSVKLTKSSQPAQYDISKRFLTEKIVIKYSDDLKVMFAVSLKSLLTVI